MSQANGYSLQTLLLFVTLIQVTGEANGEDSLLQKICEKKKKKKKKDIVLFNILDAMKGISHQK
jgi:hypothetical protein